MDAIENVVDRLESPKETSTRSKQFYCMACSVRLVFLDPGAVPDGELSLAVGFFLRQETAHQRLWNCGNSHILVQCLAPLS